MKKIIYTLFAFFALLLTTGCESWLELNPLDNPSADTFYKNEIEIQGGVNACYAYVGEASSLYLSYEYSWDTMSDLMFHRSGGFAQNVLMGITDYTEGFFRVLWLRMYQGVGRTNLILQKIEENKDVISSEKLNQMKGEVLFLRAYYYMRLTDMFGDVVYIDTPVSTPEDGMSVTRTPRVEVLKYIYNDFDKAAEYLKDSEVKELGRATYGAALAYKSRTAISNSDWRTAAESAKSLIDSREYELYDSYQELFTEDAVLSNSNKEQIFSKSHLRIAGSSTEFFMYAGPRSIGGWSTIVPTQNLIDSYECVDGKLINESPLYNKLNPYENRDPRMRASLILPGDMWCGYIFDTRMDKLTTLNEDGEEVKNLDSYSTTQYTSFTGYLLRKYLDLKYVSNITRCENPFMLCRYAEVLLNYAEAKIELNELDESCMNALNLVRKRAKMPEYSASVGQEQLRKAVRYERKVELFNEGFRRNDLNRWNRSQTVLNRPIFGRPVLGDYDTYPEVSFDEWGDPVYDFEKYEPHPSTDYRVVINPTFDPQKDNLWPISQTELNLNPNLGQNPNW
ncbi:MAG: RagB/SusD family nutrient uptake outer membrane protein [Phocaeicola sp.]